MVAVLTENVLRSSGWYFMDVDINVRGRAKKYGWSGTLRPALLAAVQLAPLQQPPHHSLLQAAAAYLHADTSMIDTRLRTQSILRCITDAWLQN
mmetsp:Transcript_18179/g.50921  ORF Transcript_18179/g.50921 Transcript_18179/m.50921 type:complete len:94 (+) Transcript_18179:189-470(+)